jgi:hypothetical protein
MTESGRWLCFCLYDVALVDVRPNLLLMDDFVAIFLALFSLVASGLIGWGIAKIQGRAAKKHLNAEIDSLRSQLNETQVQLKASDDEQIRLQTLNLRMQELLGKGVEVSLVRREKGGLESLSVLDTITDTLMASDSIKDTIESKPQAGNDILGLAQNVKAPPEGFQVAASITGIKLRPSEEKDDILGLAQAVRFEDSIKTTSTPVGGTLETPEKED